MSKPNEHDIEVTYEAWDESPGLDAGHAVMSYRERCEAAARAEERAKVLDELAKLEASLRDREDRGDVDCVTAYDCVDELKRLIAKLRGAR